MNRFTGSVHVSYEKLIKVDKLSNPSSEYQLTEDCPFKLDIPVQIFLYERKESEGRERAGVDYDGRLLRLNATSG